MMNNPCMTYPPGQGRSGPYLMKLWRRYLEQYAANEGDPENQILVGSYHAAEVLGFLSRELDRSGRYRLMIDQRTALFTEGSLRAESYQDRLLNAVFAIYNHTNTLCHQFAGGIAPVADLIRQVDGQVQAVVREADQIERCAAAMRAVFPLVCLMTMILNREDKATAAIRKVEDRFAKGAAKASSASEHLLNAVYRTVEMLQVHVSLSDAALRDEAAQIAARFEEEDREGDPVLKIRNGFCRLFELNHLLANHLDTVLAG
jgi:hypothetical protein